MHEVGPKRNAARWIVRIQHGAKSAVDLSYKVFPQLGLVAILPDETLNKRLELCEKRKSIKSLVRQAGRWM